MTWTIGTEHVATGFHVHIANSRGLFSHSLRPVTNVSPVCKTMPQPEYLVELDYEEDIDLQRRLNLQNMPLLAVDSESDSDSEVDSRWT